MIWNPLLWANWRISGRSTIFICILLAGTILVVAPISYSAFSESGDPANVEGISRGWLGIISVTQGILLLAVAPMAISRTVQREFQAGLAESHRLTPMTSLKIVLGYLSGGAVQAFGIYAVTLLFGGVFAAMSVAPSLAGKAVMAWYSGQALLLIVAFMLASLVLFSALASAGKRNAVAPVVLISVMTGWSGLPFIPGLLLLLGAFSGMSILSFMGFSGGTAFPLVLPLSAALQLCVATIFMKACCRKVRRPGSPGFTVGLGMLLVAVMEVALGVGIWCMPLVMPPGFADTVTPISQLIVSMSVLMFLAATPLVGAAAQRAWLDRAAAFDHLRGGPNWFNYTPLAAALIILPLPFILACVAGVPAIWEALHTTAGPLAWTLFAAALLLSFVTDYAIFYYASLRQWPVGRVVAFSIVALKIIPVVIELAMRANLRRGEVLTLHIACASPIGVLQAVFDPIDPAWVMGGLAVQLVLAAVAVWLAARARLGLLRSPVARPIAA